MAGTLNDIDGTGYEEPIVVLTQDAVAKIVKEYNVSPFEGGLLYIYCAAADKSGNFIDGVKYCRFRKGANGVIVLGTVKTVLATQSDITGADFNIVVSNNNVGIQATGAAATNIGWTFYVTRVSTSMNRF